MTKILQSDAEWELASERNEAIRERNEARDVAADMCRHLTLEGLRYYLARYAWLREMLAEDP